MEKQIGLNGAKQYQNALRSNLQRVSNSLNATTGLEQVITTLTQIVAGVVETKFYELNGQKLSDFVKIEVGQGAYADKLLQYAVNYVGNAGKQGLINPTANGINRDANSSVQIGSFTMENNFWRWDYSVTNELVQMAQRNAETFSIIEENEKARKRIWDLMLQDAWFNGLGDGKSYGLLNNPNVTVDTTLLTAGYKLSEMNDTAFQAFIAGLPAVFMQNSAYAINFNRLLISSADYFSLTQPFGQYGLNRLQVLEDALKRVSGNDFKIVHAKYCDNANTAGTGARYVVYNDDADNICSYLPVPYTPMPLIPQGSLDLISQAHGQFVTPFVKRTGAVLYIDEQ